MPQIESNTICNYKIEIEIETIGDNDFEYSLDEVIKKIKEGYHTGFDGNDTANYSFSVKKQVDE